MNINFELYRTFYVVATLGNITKASQELLISQPAITKQIKALESQLGGELFIRTKRGVILTDNGKDIYNFVKQGMNSFENAEMAFSNLKKLETGVIRIGVSTTLARIFLMKHLEVFHQMYPNVAIQVFTDPSKVMRKMLKSGDLDILIAKERINEDDDLDTIKLGELHQCFIASNTYRELRDKKIHLNELNDYPILLPKGPSTTRESFDKFLKDNNIVMSSKLEIASASLLEDFVRIGLGIGLVTEEFVQNELNQGDVFKINSYPLLPKKDFSLITLKKSTHSFAANELIKIILENKKD